ncbi:hypothetical protein EDB85DRAFT_1943106 [Lactarius pseudohatsudake]|nr:hypothetical protein EDB85DRAFT_1943106 [Lactarius pseudohatsudake]
MAYCDRCMRSFPHNRALEQHKEASSSHWACYDCGLDFESYDARREHYIQSPNHHYCRECDKHFNSKVSRMQHMDYQHWYCGVHDRAFKSEYGLQEHYRQSSDHYFCVPCRELFDNYSGLERHDRDVHDYCTECGRGFQNQNNLQQHLNSKQHRPSTVACPGRGCNRLFISPAALTLHFESGTCPSGMTRSELDRIVVRADRNNYITNPARLICGPLGGYEAPMSTSSWATERSWNGRAYECFLCHSMFNTLDSLNRHLKSPAHDQKIYRCPKLDCRIEFVTLSALCQHVERGTCGVGRFSQVRNAMDSLTRGFNTIAF